MNILAVAFGHGVSKPISGRQNRFSNLVKGLKEEGNKVVILEPESFTDQNDEKLAKIYSYKDYRLFSRMLGIFRDINIGFILKILEILKNERIDLIQISYPSGILAAKLITKMMRRKIPIVYDTHNVESILTMETFAVDPKYSKLERLIIPKYIGFLEKLVCIYITDHITSVSDEEKEIFIKRYKLSKQKVTVIPSGCYIHNLLDKECKNSAREEIGIDSDRVIIFFHGLFSYAPNKDAFKIIENYIAPMFKEINERVLFVMGGTGVPKFERTNIKSVGFIEDLYKEISIVDIAIVPLTRGAGTKLKVLDYLSVGLPIVTTKKGIEGIKAKNYEHAIIVDDVNEEFINAIKYLIDNEEERNRVGTNARKLAEERYDWDKIGEKLNRLYRMIIGKGHANK
jgi:glycosyltransferase involved in cell wall biosynthesis